MIASISDFNLLLISSVIEFLVRISFFSRKMNKSRGEEKAVHFTSLIFEKKKENNRKEIQIFF